MKKLRYTSVVLLIIVFLLNNFVNANTVTKPNVNSTYAILEDFETGTLLYDKNINEKLFPASTTKILTAIIAIENCDLNKIVTAKAETLRKLPPYSSNAHILPDEKMTMKELLECLLVVSGNDSALVIAEEISGSIPSFVELMNKKVKEIGCENTHFTNPHGYHDENHYTTAKDMMKILRYGMKYKEFRELMEIKQIEIPATNKNDKRIYQNTNRMFFKPEEIGRLAHYYEFNKGGKTGFTNEAQRTFVGYAEKDGRTLLVGVFHVKDINGQDGKFIDTENLYEYGFNNFNKKIIASKDTKIFSTIKNNEKKDYYLKEDLISLLPNESNNNIKIKFEYDTNDTNTFININQEQSTNSTLITINLTNIDQNPYLYHLTYDIEHSIIDSLIERIKINLYNLKLKIQ